MTTTGLESARLKLVRAHKHIVYLNEQVREFRKGDPYDFKPEISLPDPTRPEVQFRLVVTKATDVPSEWATIVGDILTNLRAALDHAVYEHVRSVKPNLKVEEIQFPIVDKRSGIENKQRWFDRPVYRVVNDAQPYHDDPDQAWHPLAILRDLVNADKHRAVIVTNYATLDLKVDTDPPLEVAHWENSIGADMEVGAVLVSGRFRVPEPIAASTRLNIRPEVAYSEAIEIPRTNGKVQNLTDVMADIHLKVRQVLMDLEAAGLK
ncbi:hypothetical protein [Nocardia beijingensis]